MKSILDFPEVVSAHIFSFLSTSELGIFGGANTKIYKNTRIATFLRAVHTTIQERTRFNVLKEGCKEHRLLEGIVTKLCSRLGEKHPSNIYFVNLVDTSSFENFNKSIRWLHGEYQNDEDWIRSINPGSRLCECVWTEDERQLVDRWLFEYDEYYKDYQDNDYIF